MIIINNTYTINDTDFYLLHQWGGYKTLVFDLPINHPQYQNIFSEVPIRYGDKNYLVKSIEELDDRANITCDLNLDSLRNIVYQEFDTPERSTLNATLLIALANTGWTVEESGTITNVATLHLTDVTPKDILDNCMTAYGVCFDFDNINNVLTVINPSNNTPKGLPISEQVNLRRTDYKNDTYDFVTRLYPYGKDGMSIAAVNQGLEYVENHQYSDKIISTIWRDDRYEIAQNLKDDAIEKLNVLSKPHESYELDVIDLPNKKIELYDVVTYMDAHRKQSINYQVVEYKEYPNQAENNVVTLSTVPEKISSWIKQEINEVNTEIIIEKTRTNEIRRDVDQNSARISQTYTSGETDTQIESLVQQALDAIRTEIAEQYVTDDTVRTYLSTLEQTVDGINLRTSVRGGYNLLQGTAAFDLENWDANGDVTTQRDTSDTVKTDSGGLFALGNETESSISQSVNTIPDGMYCYMIRYKLTGALATEATLTIKDDEISLAPTETWQTVHGTFTADGSVTSFSVSNTHGLLYVADMIIIAGAEINAWQQGQNEIITSGYRYTNGRLIIYGTDDDPLETEITNSAVYVRDRRTNYIQWQVAIDGVYLDRTFIREKLEVRARDREHFALNILPQGNGHVFVTISD